MTDTAIPRVPAAPLLSDGADRAAAVAAVAAAAEGPGFMALTGVDAALGLDPAVRTALLGFFDLANSDMHALARRKFAAGAPNVYRGVFLLQRGDPTYKEGIDIGPDLVDPAAVRPGDPLTEPTPLPPEASLPGWRAAATEYYRAMDRLGRSLIRALCEGLALPEEKVLPLFTNGLSTLRLIRYPERDEASLPADRETVRVAGEARMVVGRPHCDSGFVTLLWQDPQGGLQARGRDGRWQDVPPEPGGLAVNFGRMLADMTAGRVRATEHRVLGGLRERVSIPFFLEPAVDAPVAPFDGSAPPRPYGDLLWERMSEFVEFRGVERHG